MRAPLPQLIRHQISQELSRNASPPQSTITPFIPSQLELNDNKIVDGLEELAKYKSLETLKLANNMVATFEEVQKLKALESLTNLDLSSNRVCDLKNYRDRMFDMLPNLEALDGQDREGNDVVSDDDNEFDEIEKEEDGQDDGGKDEGK